MQDKGSFDHILENYTGGHGKYQIIIIILMTFLRLTNLHINFYQFTAYAPPNRCFVPSCEPPNKNKVYYDNMLYVEICDKGEKLIFKGKRSFHTRNNKRAFTRQIKKISFS